MPEYAIELKNVSKHFGPVVAVDEVTLSIRDGKFFSLLGPSGCGKTTTLRLIAGFELPTTGEVYIGGKLQGEIPPYHRPVNTVFQNYALFPHMTVFQNVAFGLEMRKVSKTEIRQRVLEALEMVRLPGMESRKPDQLSGGQQQRVALARALVNRRVVHFGVTRNPTDKWTAQQLREATPFGEGPRFLIRDNDKYGASFARVAVGTGIEVLRTPYRAPKANAICERFLGSLRRECLDYFLILGERHLYGIVKEHMAYFNQARPHQGIEQRIPYQPEQMETPPVSAKISSRPVLSVLHHDYFWQAAGSVGRARSQLRSYLH